MKRINIIASLVAVLLLTTHCSLDLEPIDAIGDSKAFQTIEDLEKGLVGVMVGIEGHSQIGEGDRASDDLRYAATNTGQGVQVHNWTYNASTSDMGTIWDFNAALVDRANRILAVADKFDSEDATVKRVKAELLFLRAYGHFEIARIYCKNYDANDPLGIPYKMESGVTKPARLPQGVVYANIIADIEAAIPNLNEDHEGNYFATKAAAYALKARVGLYMRDWTMAINAADEVLGYGFRLATREEFPGIWDDAMADDVEVVFRVGRLSATLGAYYTRTSNGDVFFHPSYDLMNQYEVGDIRSQLYFDVNEKGQDIVKKHDGRPNDKPNVVDLKVFRVAELMLIKAEAEIEQDNLDGAADILNDLRSNRIETPVVLSFSNGAEAMEALQLERRRELAYEGHRFYDLKRWNLGIERIDEDSETSSKILPAGDYRFVFPIPQGEIFANENMVQNDGYSN